MSKKLFYRKSSLLLTFLLSTHLGATSLSELIESGLQHNSVIKKSNLDIRMMEAKKAENQAKRFGELDVVGSYTHYNLPRTLAPIVPSALSPSSSVNTTQDLFSSGVQYSLPLFTGGALEEQVKIDSIAQQMSQSKKRLSREELIYNIRSLYLSTLSLQELLKAQKQYVNALEDLKEKIGYGVELGKKAKIDLLKANNNLVQAIGDEAKTQSSLTMLKSNLMAITHYGQIDKLDPLEVEPTAQNSSLEQENLEELERFKLQDLEIEKGSKLILLLCKSGVE